MLVQEQTLVAWREALHLDATWASQGREGGSRPSAQWWNLEEKQLELEEEEEDAETHKGLRFPP